MNTKEILHQVLTGMDAYLSCGVPEPYWTLAINLTKEVYGNKGVELITKFHKEHDGSVDANSEITLHVIEGWDDPNTYVGPEELIEKLEKL